MTEAEEKLWDEIVLHKVREDKKGDYPWRIANNVIRARRRLEKNLAKQEAKEQTCVTKKS